MNEGQLGFGLDLKFDFVYRAFYYATCFEGIIWVYWGLI